MEIPACTVGPYNPDVTGTWNANDIGYAALNYFFIAIPKPHTKKYFL